MAQLPLALEALVRLAEAAAALDPDRRGTGHHQLVDAVIAQQRLERAKPDSALGHPACERRACCSIQHPGLALHQRFDPRRRIGPAGRLPGSVDEALVQRSREGVHGIGRWIHAPSRHGCGEFAPT